MGSMQWANSIKNRTALSQWSPPMLTWTHIKVMMGKTGNYIIICKPHFFSGNGGELMTENGRTICNVNMAFI